MYEIAKNKLNEGSSEHSQAVQAKPRLQTSLSISAKGHPKATTGSASVHFWKEFPSPKKATPTITYYRDGEPPACGVGIFNGVSLGVSICPKKGQVTPSCQTLSNWGCL